MNDHILERKYNPWYLFFFEGSLYNLLSYILLMFGANIKFRNYEYNHISILHLIYALNSYNVTSNHCVNSRFESDHNKYGIEFFYS